LGHQGKPKKITEEVISDKLVQSKGAEIFLHPRNGETKERVVRRLLSAAGRKKRNEGTRLRYHLVCKEGQKAYLKKCDFGEGA